MTEPLHWNRIRPIIEGAPTHRKVKVAPNGEFVVRGTSSDKILIFNSSHPWELLTQITVADASQIFDFDISPSSEYVVCTTNSTHEAYVYDVETGNLEHTLDDMDATTSGKDNTARGVSWSECGTYLAYGGGQLYTSDADNRIYVYDPNDWSLIHTIDEELDGMVNHIKFSPPVGSPAVSQYIAYDWIPFGIAAAVNNAGGSWDRVYEAPGMRRLVSWSHDGLYLTEADATSPHKIYITETEYWTEEQDLIGANRRASTLFFTEDDALFYAGFMPDSENPTHPKIWDTATWEEISRITYQNAIPYLDLSKDDRYLFGAGYVEDVHVSAKSFYVRKDKGEGLEWVPHKALRLKHYDPTWLFPATDGTGYPRLKAFEE